MIGKLTGRLDTVSDNGAIIDVAGVGYSVFASSQTLNQLGSVGEFVTVLVETHVREDHILFICIFRTMKSAGFKRCKRYKVLVRKLLLQY